MKIQMNTHLQKDEKIANLYAVLCSMAVILLHETVVSTYTDKERKENKFFTANIKGERFHKRTGQTETLEQLCRDNIRGSLLTKFSIEETRNMRELVDKLKVDG